MNAIVQRHIRAVTVLSVAAALIQTAAADVCVYKQPKVHRACGVVVDQAGSPIPEVKVALMKNETDLQIATTNETGEFDFGGLQAGEYELDAAHAWFQHVRFRMTVLKPSNSCKHALRVRMDVGSTHCEGDGIRETKHPLKRKH